MVEGHVIDDDGKRWTMTLRDGLLWHDGTTVLARDCVASLQRWMKRDAVGATIILRLDERARPPTTAPSSGACNGRSRCWRISCPRCSRNR